MSELFKGNIISNNQKDQLIFNLGDKINIDGEEGVIIDIKFGRLAPSPIYKIKLSSGKVIYKYQNEVEEMKESRSIKELNSRIDKLFEEAPKDSQIIKEIKDLINRYENSNDFSLRHESTKSLIDLSKKLEMYSRRAGVKENQVVVKKLINYIESKSDLRFWLETNQIGYKEYQTEQTCVGKSNYYPYENIFRPDRDACFDIINSPKTLPGICVIDHIDNKRDRSHFSSMPFDINGKLTDYIPNDISNRDIKAIGDRIIQVYNANKDNVLKKGDQVKIISGPFDVGRVGKVFDTYPGGVVVEFPSDDPHKEPYRSRFYVKEVEKV